MCVFMTAQRYESVRSGGQHQMSIYDYFMKHSCPVAEAALSNVPYHRKHINKARLQG